MVSNTNLSYYDVAYEASEGDKLRDLQRSRIEKRKKQKHKKIVIQKMCGLFLMIVCAAIFLMDSECAGALIFPFVLGGSLIVSKEYHMCF